MIIRIAKLIGILLTLVAGMSVALASPAHASIEGPTWAHTAGHWGNVSVEDHTSGAWPVKTAVATWGSGLYYRSCGTSNQCVKVSEKNQGDTGQIAITSQSWTQDAKGKTHFTPLTITINSYYNTRTTAAVRSQVVTHELGHALGLGHDTWNDVMNADGVHSYNVVSPQEREELRNIYGVAA
ncbi:MAG: hypothetical protein M3Y49_12350 [Actinomycetota bacterium]|nr:hypothetical protein [Actinomycetota bacterium]